jgi:hypothetical protein
MNAREEIISSSSRYGEDETHALELASNLCQTDQIEEVPPAIPIDTHYD